MVLRQFIVIRGLVSWVSMVGIAHHVPHLCRATRFSVVKFSYLVVWHHCQHLSGNVGRDANTTTLHVFFSVISQLKLALS